MSDINLSLVVGAYPDEATAERDYESLEEVQRKADFVVVGAVIVSRDADGAVTLHERGAAGVEAGATIGLVGGLVVGLFAPPLLLTSAIGAGIGAAIGALVKRHQEKEMGADLEEYLPLESSALVVVVDETYADHVDEALENASKAVSTSIDWDDYEAIKEALGEVADTP